MIQPSERVPVEIVSGEDIPPDSQEKEDSSLTKEKSAGRDIELMRFHLGSATLGWCIFLMMLCIFLSIWNPENELVKNGFEAFKLIVMTILGYIFGSNNKL